MAILIDFHWIMKFMATLGCNVDDSNLDGNEQQTSSKKRKSKASSSATKKKRLKNGMIEGNDKTLTSSNKVIDECRSNNIITNRMDISSIVNENPMDAEVNNEGKVELSLNACNLLFANQIIDQLS